MKVLQVEILQHTDTNEGKTEWLKISNSTIQEEVQMWSDQQGIECPHLTPH